MPSRGDHRRGVNTVGGTKMGDYPEPDEPREEALRAAVHDLAKAVRRGDPRRTS